VLMPSNIRAMAGRNSVAVLATLAAGIATGWGLAARCADSGRESDSRDEQVRSQPAVIRKSPAPGPGPRGMIWIPGGEFSMGAAGGRGCQPRRNRSSRARGVDRQTERNHHSRQLDPNGTRLHGSIKPKRIANLTIFAISWAPTFSIRLVRCASAVLYAMPRLAATCLVECPIAIRVRT